MEADFVPIGPRFSNVVLQALMVLLGKRPPKDKRLLILATTSNRLVLTDMGMQDSFAADIRVPPIDSLEQLEAVIRAVDLFPDARQHAQAMQALQSAGMGEEGRLAVGVKKLLSILEMCRQDQAQAGPKLVSELMGLGTL